MAITIEGLVAEIEAAVRGNLHNFDNMYQAVNAIFHRDLDGRTPQEQNNYIKWLMMHFGSRKYWFLRVPTTRRVQLIGAIAIGKKFSDRSPALAKLVAAGEAVLNKDLGTFKVCFLLV